MVGKTTKSKKSTSKSKTPTTFIEKPNGKLKPAYKPAKKSVSPKKKFFTIAIFIIIPVAAGMISAAITGDAMSKFGEFNQPPLAPPAWLFPVAWTILYILMGVASYFIFAYKPEKKADKNRRTAALVLYFLQLAFNFAWSPIFFVAENFSLALYWLLIMWFMLMVVMFLVRERSLPAMWCLLPYALWCLFAMYLNIGILLLN